MPGATITANVCSDAEIKT